MSTVTPAQAAKRLGVTPRTIRNWIAGGRIRAYRISDRVTRIPLDEVERLAIRGRAGRPDLRSILWDVRETDLDEDAHAQFIIRRVLEAGRPEHVGWVFRRYPRETIADVVALHGALPRPVARAWSELLRRRDERAA